MPSGNNPPALKFRVSVYDGFDILIVVWGSVAGIATLSIFVIIIYIYVKTNTDIIASIQRKISTEETQETYETPDARRDSHIYNQDQQGDDNQSDNNQYLEVRASTTSDISKDNIQSRLSTKPTTGDIRNQLLYTGNIPNRVSGKQVEIPGEADHNRSRDQNHETVYEVTDLDNSS
ncbi:unnamed protein product [Mytilus coruscus]|uniref:Uncharacterized protein n=1 Tax=Mytilus coruscus TaxID=42192 RepID=A0A6J8F212_MYTCO|nr:unnamed protein product [Mytilus coruscus]